MQRIKLPLDLRQTDIIWPLSTSGRTYFLMLSSLCLLLLLMACSKQGESDESSTYEVQIIQPRYAKGFSLAKHPDFQVLHILQPFNDETDTISYLLLSDNQSVPDGFDRHQVIRVPIKNFVALTTTHIALADFFDATDKIIGMSGAEYAYHPSIRARAKSGDLKPVGGGESLNKEQVLSLNPSLVMISGFSQAAFERDYRPILDLGIPVLVNSEWMEKTMLGRAEWVKVMGSLLQKSDVADRKFQKIEEAYLALAQKGRNASEKPLVVGGLPYKGVWSVAGANSYIANLLADAGADWNWANDSVSVSMQMDFEAVYPIGLKAPFWLRAGSAQSKQALLAIDPRFEDFKSFQLGNIYNNNKRMSSNGTGNDYWESGLTHPHLILQDLIQILHPEMEVADSLYYYQKME